MSKTIKEMKLDAVASITKLDAAQSVFFGRQLETISNKLYDAKYPDLEAEMFLPAKEQVPAGSPKYTWRWFDKRGKAVPFAGHENGAPMVDVEGNEDSTDLMSFTSAYGWDVEQLDAAKMAGFPLTDRQALAARRALAESLNDMALRGYAPKGIRGLFNLANTLTATVPNGASASPLWTSKTADEQLADLFLMADIIPNNTIDQEKPSMMLLPKESIRVLSAKRLSNTGTTNVSVYQYFVEQVAARNSNLKIMGANYLNTAGAGGTRRAVIYDPSQVAMLWSIPFEEQNIEQQGFSFKVNCRARGGGVFTPYPKSVAYVDGF